MAFFDPEGTASVAGRAHLLTAEQFADVTAQEMRLSPGGEFAQALATLLPQVEAPLRMGPGRYETVVPVGTRDGNPLLTLTNGDVPGLTFAAPKRSLPAVDRDRAARGPRLGRRADRDVPRFGAWCPGLLDGGRGA